MVERSTSIEERIIEGLSQGTPLAVLCRELGVGRRTVYDWRDADEALAARIARAREVGFDAIAEDALAIADATEHDTVKGENGDERPNTEWITRSRLRVETRLKLLAKWDPKRYGDKTLIGSDPENPLPAGFDVRLLRTNGPDAG
jgi:hypothetical protein